ncbi:hypothetical protein FO519_010659, partial [Halicephalobus sp. NKZ332]
DTQTNDEDDIAYTVLTPETDNEAEHNTDDSISTTSDYVFDATDLLSGAELAHLTYIKRLVECHTIAEPINQFMQTNELQFEQSISSSATSGADAEAESSMEAFSYDRGEPLLSSEIPEVITEEKIEPPSRPPLPPPIQTQASLTADELAHIEYVKRMAEQSSFENVISKPVETKKESVESSATSGADAEAGSSMEAFSYDRGEPLLSSEI